MHGAECAVASVVSVSPKWVKCNMKSNYMPIAIVRPHIITIHTAINTERNHFLFSVRRCYFAFWTPSRSLCRRSSLCYLCIFPSLFSNWPIALFVHYKHTGQRISSEESRQHSRGKHSNVVVQEEKLKTHNNLYRTVDIYMKWAR